MRPALVDLFAFGFHRVPQDPQALDLYNHLVAVFQRPTPAGVPVKIRSRGLERHDGGDEGDQRSHAEDHIACGGHLARLPINLAGDQGVGHVELRVNPGAEGAECIEALGACPIDRRSSASHGQ